jgi:hypothetical protein
MHTVAGIFASREAAVRAIKRVSEMGLRNEDLNVLAPGTAEPAVNRVPADEGEQPGTGTAIGAVVGAATGASLGLPLGAVIASAVIPGIGPIIAAGALGAAIFGAGGAAVGHALEDTMTYGLSRDELAIYKEALRRQKIVVLARTEDDTKAAELRKAFDTAGAESVDRAREDWWVGLREGEASAYAERGGDFARDEDVYRRGFEAAMLPFVKGRGYDQALAELHVLYPEVCQADAFRCGFDRGRAYDEAQQTDDQRAA